MLAFVLFSKKRSESPSLKISPKRLERHGLSPPEFKEFPPPLVAVDDNPTPEVQGNLLDLAPMAPTKEEVLEAKKRQLQKKGCLTKPYDPESPLNTRLKKVPKVGETNFLGKEVSKLFVGARDQKSTLAAANTLQIVDPHLGVLLGLEAFLSLLHLL
ncbi:unnamed protein product [Ilex paraguariensis]|uniref:Uncharacterized protein n=1 Tax=Ilex paraguariensis TaxID=185542 RepID=A0ABC8QLI6_9AQUA